MDWEDIGFLVGQNLGNAIVNRMNNKEEKDVYKAIDNYKNNITDDEVNAAKAEVGNGIVGNTPQNLVVSSKKEYENAKKIGDITGMAAANKRADVARSIGKNMGIDMTGYGADNTLSSINDLEAKKNGYPTEVKSKNIGKGLYLNSNIDSKIGLPTGIFSGSGTESFQMSNNPKGVFDSVYLSNLQNNNSGPMVNIDWKNISSRPKTKEEILAGYRDDSNNNKITFDDLSKTTKIDYDAKAKELAKKSRLLDPDYTNNVERMLVDRGYRPELIDKVMGRVKEDTKKAQIDYLSNACIESYKNGNTFEASKYLSRLVGIDPSVANVLSLQLPSIRDVWNSKKISEDAENEHKWRSSEAEKDRTIHTNTRNIWG